MAEDKDHKAQAIIVKKIIKGGGGHHGGSWKVAYADFVTAMMAFFLLLWLLATTTPEKRAGIAEYFTPTVGLKDSKGIGFEGGLTPNEKGHSRTTLTSPGMVAGQVNQGPQPTPAEPSDTVSTEEQQNAGAIMMPENSKPQQADSESKPEQQENVKSKSDKDDKDEAEALKKAQEALTQMLEQSAELEQLRKNIIITNTPEGLKIDVVDDPEHPVFLEGTATMTDTGRMIFKAISGVIAKTRNQLSITGHIERTAYPAGATYTAWELTADRANATRRFLSESLPEAQRMAKVVGMADKELLLPKEPENPRNRRISVTLLRGALMVDTKGSATTRDLLSVPEVDTSKLKPPAPPPPPPPKPKQPIEIPEAKPGSIFHQKAKDAPQATDGSTDADKPAPGFTAPASVPPAPPPAPKVEAPEPPRAAPAPEAPPPDSIFNGKEKKGFDVPANVPAAPKDAPKDDAPPPAPVEAPQPAAPDSLFTP